MKSTKLKPVTKKQAMLIFNELTIQGKEPSKVKLCNNKYNWHGSAKYYQEQEYPVSSNVKAIWVERRQDNDGPYAIFMCVAVY